MHGSLLIALAVYTNLLETISIEGKRNCFCFIVYLTFFVPWL